MKYLEKNKTYFTFNHFLENCAVYEIMWKDIVERSRPHMTIWRKRIACWITNVTNTHSEYVMLIALPQHQSLHESASALRYKYIACLVYSEWYTKTHHHVPEGLGVFPVP